MVSELQGTGKIALKLTKSQNDCWAAIPGIDQHWLSRYICGPAETNLVDQQDYRLSEYTLGGGLRGNAKNSEQFALGTRSHPTAKQDYIQTMGLAE